MLITDHPHFSQVSTSSRVAIACNEEFKSKIGRLEFPLDENNLRIRSDFLPM